MLRSTSIRISCGLIKHFQRASSSTPHPAVGSDKVPEDIQDNSLNNNIETSNVIVPSEKTQVTARSSLVTNAFANLQHNQPHNKVRNPLEDSIRSAKTPEELLSLSQNSILTKRQAMKIVTTLSEWSMSGKYGDVDFESDPRFVALCQMLSRPNSTKNSEAAREGDLSVVLGVMGEDEATKMVKSITLPQMIKVLSSLSFKRRRSMPLLKSLATGISISEYKLDVKQAADILYGIACLNFPDEELLEKVCRDLLETIPSCQKSAVIGSICTSIGLLRYKDVDLLNCLCEWGVKNKAIARMQDMVSLILCIASVNHTPNADILEVIQSQATEEEVPSASTWLDVVWALSILRASNDSHLSSVLEPKFIERLSTSGNLNPAWKKKLLNINGLAKLTKGYKGPLLNIDSNFDMPLKRSKDKQILYSSLVDTLSNVFPSTNHFQSSVDTGMGFIIDAECAFDAKQNPIPLIDKKTGQPIASSKPTKRKTKKKEVRIAILLHEYHDCTRGTVEPSGAASICARLTELSGYNVIPILYKDYNPQTKLIDRAKQIEGLIKQATSPST